MRGLKQKALSSVRAAGVASFTDAWIETFCMKKKERTVQSHLLQMRGLKQFDNLHTDNMQESHLLQMRGLKLMIIVFTTIMT